MIKYYTGDILESDVNIICQQVNHQGVMGSGLAKQIKDKYPDVMTNYLNLCKIDFEKLRRNGIISWCAVDSNKYIASIFGQDHYGTDRNHTDYYALSSGLETVRQYAETRGFSVGIPHGIGCGLGGGDWSIVSAIIRDVFKYSPNLDVRVYKFPLDK